MKLALRLALCLAVLVTFIGVLLMFAGVLTVKASASAIPGDPLYGVKRAWEEARLTTTIQEQSRQQLLTRMETERRAEIAKLLKLRRDTVVEFDGVLEQTIADHFVVSGITTNITAQTLIEGIPIVGYRVEVLGHITPDGLLVIHKLLVKDTGTNKTIPAVSPTQTFTPTFTVVPSITRTPTAALSPTPRHIATLAPSPAPKHTTIPPVVPLLKCDDDDCGDDDGEDDDGEDDDGEDDDGEDDDDEDDDGEDDDGEDDDGEYDDGEDDDDEDDDGEDD